MSTNDTAQRYKNSLKLICTAAFLLFALWFAYQTVAVLFLFFFAVVLTLVLNAPTMWLISKKLSRTAAALIVFGMTLIFLFLIGWLVVPKILEQLSGLISNLPSYYSGLRREISELLTDYPTLQQKVLSSTRLENSMPSVTKVLTNVGRFSFSLIGGVFLLVMFFSIVLYMLLKPAPLLDTYLNFFSEENEPKAAQALARGSKMMVGWMWSNLVVGSMEAVAVFIFLSYMDIPGVWIWVGLALFAEMVPKLGLYIMAIPPVIIALSIDPMTALWVLIFYLVLNEIMGDLVMPKVRSSTMNLHPVSSLFVMLAMGSAFGLVGALIATPLTAFIKAYYEEFFLKTTNENANNEAVEMILKRDTESETEIKT